MQTITKIKQETKITETHKLKRQRMHQTETREHDTKRKQQNQMNTNACCLNR